MDINVQVCGRREKVSVKRATIRDLVSVVGREFEVRPPFIFAAHDGRMLSDDRSLAEYVETGDTVVVKLTEGVMHDFSRRMDQLRHLQWGFLSDQLAHVKQDAGGKKEIANINLQLQQEQATREAGEEEMRRGLEAVQDSLRKERNARDALLQTVEDKIAELELRIDKAAQPHEAAASALQQGITELARSLGDERKHREHGEAMLRQERQELQAELRSEISSQLEIGARLRKEIAQTQSSVESVQSAWRTECLELRQGFSDMRQALSSEQQERAAAEGRSTSAVHQAQRLVAQDVKDRSAAQQALETSVRNLETSLEQARGEIKRVRRENEDFIAKDRSTGSAANSELSVQLELLRRTIDHETNERKMVSQSLDRIADDVERRCNEEVKSRQNEVEKLLRMIAGVRGAGLDLDTSPAFRKSPSMGGEGDARAVRELQQDLVATKSELKSMVDAALRELRDSGGKSFRESSEGWSAALQKLREDCKEAMQREVRSRVEREKATEKSLDKLRDGLQRHTHELHVEGMGVSRMVTTGGASVPYEASLGLPTSRSQGPPTSRSQGPSTSRSMPARDLGGGAAASAYKSMPPSSPSRDGGSPAASSAYTSDLVSRSQTQRPSFSRSKTYDGSEGLVSRSRTSMPSSQQPFTSRSASGNLNEFDYS